MPLTPEGGNRLRQGLSPTANSSQSVARKGVHQLNNVTLSSTLHIVSICRHRPKRKQKEKHGSLCFKFYSLAESPRIKVDGWPN